MGHVRTLAISASLAHMIAFVLGRDCGAEGQLGCRSYSIVGAPCGRVKGTTPAWRPSPACRPTVGNPTFAVGVAEYGTEHYTAGCAGRKSTQGFSLRAWKLRCIEMRIRHKLFIASQGKRRCWTSHVSNAGAFLLENSNPIHLVI